MASLPRSGSTLSAYAEDPGCQAGDECVGRTLLRQRTVSSFGEEALPSSLPAGRQGQSEGGFSLLRRIPPKGFKVPRALARGAPCFLYYGCKVSPTSPIRNPELHFSLFFRNRSGGAIWIIGLCRLHCQRLRFHSEAVLRAAMLLGCITIENVDAFELPPRQGEMLLSKVYDRAFC